MNILVVTLKNPPLGSEQSFSEISTHAVTNHLDEIYNYLAVGWVEGQRFGIGWLWHGLACSKLYELREND